MVVQEYLLAAVVSSRISHFLLLLGLAAFAGGFLLMFHHLRQWREVWATERDPRVRLFERRKFRRRTTVAALVSATGTTMTATYWVVDPRTFAVMMGLLVLLLLGILGLASLDLLSVSLQRLAVSDQAAQQAMVEKYLELRQKLQERDGQQAASTGEGHSDSKSSET